MTQHNISDHDRIPPKHTFDPAQYVFNPAQCAAYLSTTTAALAMHRTRGTGPRYSKLTARMILYRRADVDAWIESNLRSQTDGMGE